MKSFIVQTLLLLLLNPLATADEYYYCNCIKHHKIDVKSTTEMCRQNYMPGPDGVNATLITRQPNQDVPNGCPDPKSHDHY
ncbi:hypothetical protein P8C59_000562 [Phyllachora maydis]|uniref:Secreted protein n=1 Tax=Phyllachora maydis TaxID=1825666 RepID=A0AAD9HXG4_9PEZI|nr:hypothetical protein P8C59_000562 [Phyllachora maydis]